jgi:GMP synthase-like glutamine amidotransferase
MRIHFLMHETFEGPGCIDDWIKQKGYTVKISRTFLREPYPGMEYFDWLIIMGGTMSVFEEEKYNWLKTEKEFIRQSVESGKIILGICFGAQLVAEVLGAKVYQAKEKEIGWFPVNLIKSNLPSILKTLPANPTVFHWHGDTFDLPEGAIHLASSEANVNQAFLYRNKVLALQYHHEINKKAMNLMLENMGKQLKKDRYVQAADEIMSGANHINENNLIMFMIMDFLDTLK